MKMHHATFMRLRLCVESTLPSVSQTDYGTPSMRDMWNAAHAGGVFSWIYDTPQQLNDSHIDTALRRIRESL